MKHILITIGAGRLIAVALTAGIAAGALIAAPLFASASGAEDTPTSQRESPAYQSLLDRIDRPAFIESSNITTDAFRWANGGGGELGFTWTAEGSSDSGPSFGFAADFGSGDPVHVGGNLVETVAELTGADEDAVVEALDDGQTLAEYAEAHGVSEDALLDALLSDAEERLAEAVESGDLSEEEADRIRTELREHLSDLVNGNAPFGIDHRAVPGDFPFIGGIAGHIGPEIDPIAKVAELTGTEAEDVLTALEDGQTLTEFAAEHGVGEDELVAAIMAGAEERAAEAVAEGDLTQEEADEMLANLEEHARAMINGEGFGIHRDVVPGRLESFESFDGFFLPGECDDVDESQEPDGESTSSQI